MTALQDHAPTPVADTRRRRVTGWIVIAVVLVGVGIVGSLLAGIGQWNQRDVLDPESAGPNGTRALAEILREHGVDVVVVRDRAAAQAALAGDAATLALPDAPYLSDEAVTALTDAAADVALIDPRARTLRLFLPGSSTYGVGPGSVVDPACELADADRAGGVAPGAIYEPGAQMTACYPTGGGYGLLAAERPGGRSIAVDGRALFTNEHLAEDGNAALAVNLLGRHPTLVWYMPDIADSDLSAGDPTLGELTPPWVSPVIMLLLVAGIAAAIWRGRRFGPLVVERLPVTVRAAETTEGRARLYAHARDALHAADQLRIGSLGRLGRLLGLGPSASAEEIADAAAARGRIDRGAVRGILIDELPRTDAELVALAQRLRALEEAVHTAVRPERNTR
ncbi:protein of unknown function [Microbacterium sp. cf046]|uniref:DUF4350 domain-containing protein n=1 Tax=Microbacterium sp. cf046 TaxID=1761803 RepID=UPI0008E45897|nr:DUF4350 domain-containing protein [Microbacterium sp. cf046]SFR99380.1 protein of unknown function [Microbacterium sp. cf046]